MGKNTLFIEKQTAVINELVLFKEQVSAQWLHDIYQQLMDMS